MTTEQDLEFTVSVSEQRETVERLEYLVQRADRHEPELRLLVANVSETILGVIAACERKVDSLERTCDDKRRNQQRLFFEQRIRTLMRRQRLTRDQALLTIRHLGDELRDSIPSLSSEARAKLRSAIDELNKPVDRDGFKLTRTLLDNLRHVCDDLRSLV